MNSLPIAQAVLVVRLKKNLSQRQVAERMKIKRTYLSKVENGKLTPTIPTLIAISEAMGVEPWKLLRYACRLRDAAPKVAI